MLPVHWSDNFVTLFEGESVELSADYDAAAAGGQTVGVTVEAYNSVKISPKAVADDRGGTR